MYFKSILPTVALFFLTASSANAVPREPQAPNQILARSPHLLIRQGTGFIEGCNTVCVPLDSTVEACGYDEACQCGPAVSGPLLDCARCTYKQTTSVSLRNELVGAAEEYVDECKAAGHPIQGDTSVTGSPSVQASSSAGSSASASASATAGSSSTSNTKSVTNGATGAISRSAADLAIPVFVVAVFGFMV